MQVLAMLLRCKCFSHILVYFLHSLQTSSQILSHLWDWCDESHPEKIRMAIADTLGRNFMLFVKTIVDVVMDETCASFTFWKMVTILLQDESLHVRMQLCKSLYGVIAESG